ncbi:hypothetical protein [Vibrio salinus]|nr:hypothetical protein [Vibrio salinus]
MNRETILFDINETVLSLDSLKPDISGDTMADIVSQIINQPATRS